jgi:hypothetical protein
VTGQAEWKRKEKENMSAEDWAQQGVWDLKSYSIYLGLFQN